MYRVDPIPRSPHCVPGRGWVAGPPVAFALTASRTGPNKFRNAETELKTLNRSAIATPPALPPSVLTLPLAEGDVGTTDTVRWMCRLVDEGARDPEINRAAVAIVRAARVPEFNFGGERRAIFNWKDKNIRFIRDIEGKETLRSARETLLARMGDCDCQTILTCALLKSIGQLVRIVTISTHPEAPDVFSHVYPEVRDERGRWIPVDTARKQRRYGLGPNHWFRRRVWDTDDGTWQDADEPAPSTTIAARPVFAGLSYYGANPRNHLAGTPRQRRRLAAFNARKRYLTGLGQDSSDFDWSQLETEIPSIEVGTADVVAAARANPVNLVPTTNPAATVAASSMTQAAQALYAQSLTGSSGTLLLLGGGLLLVVLMMGRK
jgi:hypothetical protein